MKKEIAEGGIYGIPEMAEILDISQKTLRDMIKRKEIPVTKVGRRFKFCGWKIRAWLESRAV